MVGNNKTILFLGAGASKDFGYPLTNGILPIIVERLLAGSLFPKEKNPQSAKIKTERLRKYLGELLPGVFDEEVKLPLITEILSLIDHLVDTGNVSVPMLDTNSMIEFRALLEEAIIASLRPNQGDKRGKTLLERLTDWVWNFYDINKIPLTVISTNYDTHVESRLFKQLVCEPEQRSDASEAIDFGFSWKEHATGRFHQDIHHQPKAPRLRLFKLHGSLNWLCCPLCESIYIDLYGDIYGQASRVKIDYNNTCACGHAPVRYVIVAPSILRSVKDANLLTIWKNALESLRAAGEWIIVGYSLPAEDIAIRSILLSAYNGRGKDKKKKKPPPKPKIRVVQKMGKGPAAKAEDQAMRGRYRLLFPDCSFEYGGFEEFIKNLPKSTKHYPVF